MKTNSDWIFTSKEMLPSTSKVDTATLPHKVGPKLKKNHNVHKWIIFMPKDTTEWQSTKKKLKK